MCLSFYRVLLASATAIQIYREDELEREVERRRGRLHPYHLERDKVDVRHVVVHVSGQVRRGRVGIVDDVRRRIWSAPARRSASCRKEKKGEEGHALGFRVSGTVSNMVVSKFAWIA